MQSRGVTINSSDDADTLRQNCQTVNGTITIGPFAESTETLHINLDGVEVIKGSPQAYENDFENKTVSSGPFTVASSTQRSSSICGLFQRPKHFMESHSANLTTVHAKFHIAKSPITYLDIAALESVFSFTLTAENLTTVHHAKFINLTWMTIDSMRVKSLDSFSSTTLSMSLIQKRPDRSQIPELKLLTATDLTLSDTAITRLDIPFDDLTLLRVGYEKSAEALTEIRLPSSAVNWTGFKFLSFQAPNQNLSSQYGTDDDGNRFQTWYWPTDVSDIIIEQTIVDNPFFDAFVTQQMKSLNSTPRHRI
ncbi:hypothetical protein N7490_011750 [Penicillium lividum]|nr:hypothetical protein N7490_011750 [Penicillium lividum]